MKLTVADNNIGGFKSIMLTEEHIKDIIWVLSTYVGEDDETKHGS